MAVQDNPGIFTLAMTFVMGKYFGKKTSLSGGGMCPYTLYGQWIYISNHHDIFIKALSTLGYCS